MIQSEIAGTETIQPSLLFNHAQDTLMTVMSEIHPAEKMIQVFESFPLESEDFANAEDLLAAILILGVEDQFKRGVSRAYIEEESPLTAVRPDRGIHPDVQAKCASRLRAG